MTIGDPVPSRRCADNPCFRLAPARAFGTAEHDPTGSPTRWTFPA